MSRVKRSFCVFFILIGLVGSLYLSAQRPRLSKDEYAKRRTALMKAVGNKGVIVLFGLHIPFGANHFRQDNDFYYFSGVRDHDGILVMEAATGRSSIYLPKLTGRKLRFDGGNLLSDSVALEKSGLDAAYPEAQFNEYMDALGKKSGEELYLRLMVGDDNGNGRFGMTAKNLSNMQRPFVKHCSRDEERIKKIKKIYPGLKVKDITQAINNMRIIKTAGEIAILRRNGKISAAAHCRAMKATRPGGYEYQVEAAAIYEILKNGCLGPAYPPIVASGKNAYILHYNRNNAPTKAGEMILMDFGGELDNLCIDITRTWPVTGKFTPRQREVYQVVLDVQKAIIKCLRPGITHAQIREYVDKVMKEKGTKMKWPKGRINHFVGLSTHDVGFPGMPISEGMVIAIEPGMYNPEDGFAIRIEDTVLVTENGCEVLTKDVPKEIKEIEALMASK